MMHLPIQRLPFLCFFLVLMSSGTFLYAQNADKLLAKAENNYKLANYTEAEELFKSVLNVDPSNFQAVYRLGRINSYLEDYREALSWYQRAVEIDPGRNDTVHLQLGITQKILGNCAQAIESFNQFKQRHQVQDSYYQLAELEIEGCELITAFANRPASYRVGGASFNSTEADVFPAYLDQRQEDVFLAFTSHRPTKGKNKPYSGLAQQAFSDLYTVVIENDSTFSVEVENMGAPINTKNNDGAATFTADGLTMFFTICNDKKNKLGCSIFESKYDPQKKEWGKPIPITGVSQMQDVVINSKGKTKKYPTDDRHPSISRDGMTLFFSSDRKGGQGGYDIWYTRRSGLGWAQPANAGPAINTPFDEYSPNLNSENNRLYFASNGRAGYGGLDLFMSEGEPGNWQEPQNLGAPVNSSYDDLAGMWLPGDTTFYFSSNRPGGFGSYDIYWGVTAIPYDQRFPISVQGMVRDKQTLQPIPFSTAILYEFDEDGFVSPIDTFQTDQSARYNFPLKFKKEYKILANAPEYLANEIDVSTQDVQPGVLERNIDIELEPIIIGLPIVLQNIYYDYDEYYIRPDARPTLDDLVKTLQQNPNIIIQMGSHTDSNGTLLYNDELSENRAYAAIRYLIDSGINPARLYYKGFGEREPLITPELSDADEQVNRRTEFRILSIDFQ